MRANTSVAILNSRRDSGSPLSHSSQGSDLPTRISIKQIEEVPLSRIFLIQEIHLELKPLAVRISTRKFQLRESNALGKNQVLVRHMRGYFSYNMTELLELQLHYQECVYFL